MSRRVKKPLRPAGDRPKGARPYRGSQAERPAHPPGGKPPARFSAATPRVPKPFVPEPEKIVAEPPPLPTKVHSPCLGRRAVTHEFVEKRGKVMFRGLDSSVVLRDVKLITLTDGDGGLVMQAQF